MAGNTTVVPKFTKPLGGKPFVIPSGVQNGAASIKNIPVVVAVSSKKKLENKKDFSKSTGGKVYEKKVFTTKPAGTSTEKQLESKKSVTKSVKSVVTTNNWWDDSSGSALPRLVFAEEQPWYTQYPTYVGQEIDISTPDNSKINESRFAPILKSVEAAFQAEQAYHSKKNGKSDSDQKWINDVIKSGTLSDKVAALALRVQEAPFYQLDTLDILVQMACKKEQRTSQLALEAIKDLLANNLLPDRKLTVFRSSLLLHSEMNMTTALMLYYEDQLKTRIERVMEALDNGLKSTVDYFKKLCLEMAASLLMSKPEQEARLLSMIVNKLGDPSSKICSKCISVLRNVVSVHPAMKVVIVREVRQFIYRPNIKLKSIFNGVIFLSQVTLVRGDHNVAAQLVECYVSLFEKAVKEDELGSRLLSALLTGINKSFPYLDNIEPISKYADSLFRLVHTASFTSSTQALMLLSHLAISSSDAVVKEKPTKEKKVLQEGVTDEDDEEVVEVVETPVQPDDLGSDIMRRYYRALYAKLLSDQVTSRAKNTLLLNLLYRSIKRDPSEHRAMAFLKRLSICATQASPSIAAGLLFLVSEIIASRPSLKLMLDSAEEASIFTTQEIYLAAVDEDESHHMLGNFDASKREPEYAAAARPSMWEGALMRRHFHPSVQAFAHALLEAPTHRINFAGDPTTDFSLMAFLNRFAYKNPKKSVAEKIQGQQRRQGLEEEPMNVSKFIRSDEAEVAPDKHFFHKYFGERAKLREDGRSRDRSKKRKGKRDSDSGSSDESDGEASGSDGDDEEKEEKRAKKQEKKDKKASKSASGGGKQLDSDEEAEMDAFATQLAEDMMRDKDSTFDMDPDMDDWSEDEEGSDDDNSDIGSGNDFTDEDDEEINSDEGEDDSQDDDEDEDASDYSDEEGGDGMLQAYQSSDDEQQQDEEESEEEAPVLSKKQTKTQKSQKSTDAVDFADYLKQQSASKTDSKKAVKSDKTPAAQKFVDEMKNTLSKKATKKGKKITESDSDDDAFGGLETYVSESEPEAPPVKASKKSDKKAVTIVETKKDSKNKAKKTQSADDDLEVVESYSDYSSLDEEEDFDVLFGEGDGGDKKGKRGGKQQQLKGKKGAKDTKTKRKRGDDGGDFASAEDYEGEMDAILKQIQQHNSGETMDVEDAPSATISSNKKGGATANKGAKKFRK